MSIYIYMYIYMQYTVIIMKVRGEFLVVISQAICKRECH